MTASVHPHPAPDRPLPSPARPRPSADAPDAGPVVVPASARFEGLLTFRGRAQVHGEIEGEVLCRGTLVVGAAGQIVGTIEADEVVVAGSVQGDITARGRIELTPSARVQGTLRAPRIHLADGCVLDGRCETGDASRT